MIFMDIDGDGGIDRDEFLIQMEKANKLYDAL